jgi:hypothetical protein
MLGLNSPLTTPMPLADVLTALKDSGAAVTLISPDEASAAAIGRNSLDPATRGVPGPREAPRARRTGERTAQGVGHPRQAALLPVAHRETRQSYPRIAAPRGITSWKQLTDGLGCRPLSRAVFAFS